MEKLLTYPNLLYLVGGFVALNVVYRLYRKAAPFLFALKSKPVNLKENSTLTETQQRPLACGANLSSQNQIFLNALETGTPTQTIYNFLFINWGLTSRAAVIETLERLATKPFSPVFDYIAEVRKNGPSQDLAI